MSAVLVCAALCLHQQNAVRVHAARVCAHQTLVHDGDGDGDVVRVPRLIPGDVQRWVVCSRLLCLAQAPRFLSIEAGTRTQASRIEGNRPELATAAPLVLES